MSNLGAYAKSIVATVLGALAPIVIAAVTHKGTLTSADLIAAALTALGIGGSVFGVKNTKAAVSGIVVTLKTDADKFLSVLLAGLPAVVEAAAQAALSPAPITVTGGNSGMVTPGASTTNPAVAAVAADTLAPPSAG